MINWGIYGDCILGSYTICDGYGIIIQMEESLWAEKRKTIINLIESAQIY